MKKHEMFERWLADNTPVNRAYSLTDLREGFFGALDMLCPWLATDEPEHLLEIAEPSALPESMFDATYMWWPDEKPFDGPSVQWVNDMMLIGWSPEALQEQTQALWHDLRAQWGGRVRVYDFGRAVYRNGEWCYGTNT